MPPYVITHLSVSVQAKGKKRLILDLRYVNSHLQKKSIKYEDWKVAISYFECKLLWLKKKSENDLYSLNTLAIIHSETLQKI